MYFPGRYNSIVIQWFLILKTLTFDIKLSYKGHLKWSFFLLLPKLIEFTLSFNKYN